MTCQEMCSVFMDWLDTMEMIVLCKNTYRVNSHSHATIMKAQTIFLEERNCSGPRSMLNAWLVIL